MITGALNPDPTKFQSKSVQSVRSRVGNIRSFLASDMDLPEFWQYLRTFLGKSGMIPGKLADDELAAIRKLKQCKYDTWDWNYGKSPQYSLCCKHRWSSGLLEACVSVKEGKICAITFRGDFLSVYAPEILCEALVGCPYQEEALATVLKELPVSAYLGGITARECIDTILNKV